MMQSRRHYFRLAFVSALIAAVLAGGVRAPMACASMSAEEVTEQASPAKCKCGKKGACCANGCCRKPPAKPAENESDSTKSERRDLSMADAAAMVLAGSVRGAFPHPTSTAWNAPTYAGTLVAQHTCLQV